MKKNIFFIGFMGTGKTTIGKLVSQKLGFDFIDTDAAIEEQLSMSISDIFENYGEDYFRELENKIVMDLTKGLGTIISTGGGTPLYHNNMEIMKENGLVITLETSANILWARLKNCRERPLLREYNTFDKFSELYAHRNKIYRLGHYIIKTDGKSRKQVVDEAIKYILD